MQTAFIRLAAAARSDTCNWVSSLYRYSRQDSGTVLVQQIAHNLTLVNLGLFNGATANSSANFGDSVTVG